MGAEFPDVSYLRRLKEHLSARNIDIPRDPHQGHEGSVVVRAVDLLLNSHTPLHRRGLGGCKEPGGLSYLILGNPGNAFHPFEWILIDPVHKRLPAMDMVLHKSPVIELFIHNDVEHSKGKGRVSTGP